MAPANQAGLGTTIACRVICCASHTIDAAGGICGTSAMGAPPLGAVEPVRNGCEPGCELTRTGISHGHFPRAVRVSGASGCGVTRPRSDGIWGAKPACVRSSDGDGRGAGAARANGTGGTAVRGTRYGTQGGRRRPRKPVGSGCRWPQMAAAWWYAVRYGGIRYGTRYVRNGANAYRQRGSGPHVAHYHGK